MKERPILFSAPMVRAILAGEKTQTRRVVKPQPQMVTDDRKTAAWDGQPAALQQLLEKTGRGCPYGRPGDRLYVRETFFAYGCWETRSSVKNGRDEWYFVDRTEELGLSYKYAADAPEVTTSYRNCIYSGWHRRPAIFMPRRAVRIVLEVVSVRVERLQDISEADCWAEGVDEVIHLFDGHSQYRMAKRLDLCLEDAKPLYAQLWESINGAGSWDKNPWVWVVEFKRVPV